MADLDFAGAKRVALRLPLQQLGPRRRVGEVSENSITLHQARLARRAKTSCRRSDNFARTRADGQFVISRARGAYDARARGPNQKFLPEHFRLLLRVCLLTSSLVCLLAAPSLAQIKVPLTVQEAIYPGVQPTPRIDEPVTVGIPLPEYAAMRNASDFGLEGANVGQFRVLAWWPSGSIKWILVDTQADVDSSGKGKELVLTTGRGDFGGESLAKDSPGKIEIRTGVAEFTIRKSGFNLIDRAVVANKEIVRPGASRGLVLTGPAPGLTICDPCKTAYSSSNDAGSTAEIEENGPARAVIKATGAHKDPQGHVYMRFTVRMTFYKGKSYLKITSILRNADDNTSHFNSAFKGFASYEAQLSPALSGSRSFSFGTDAVPIDGTFRGTEDAYLYQAYSNNLEHEHWSEIRTIENSGGHREAVQSYIDRQSSGEDSSGWHYQEEGYKVVLGTATLAHGTRDQAVAGWADLRDSSGAGVLVGVPQLSAFWPKSLEFRGGGSDVRLGIWPAENTKRYYQSWPQYSTQDLWIDFHDAALASPTKEFTKLQHFLIARAPLSYYNDAGVFPYALMDPAEEDAYYRSLNVACCVADVQPVIFRYYYWSEPGEKNQSELRWAYLMQWLTRGLPGRYLTAGYFYRFVADQGFPRSDGFEWRTHNLDQLDFWGFPSGESSNRSQAHRCWIDQNHAHWYGMTDYYFLTGDETIRDALLDGVKDRFLNPQAKLNDGSLGSARAVGAALMSFSRFHAFLTSIHDRDAEPLLSIADKVLKKEVLPEFGVNGFGGASSGISRVRGVYGNNSYTVKYKKVSDVRVAQTFLNSILIEGMWEYAQERGPLWPGYEELMDLAYGLGQWALYEMFIDTGELSTSGFRYLIFLDTPNSVAENPDFHVSALGNVMFPFFIIHEWTGDTSWKHKFEIALEKSAQSFGNEWPRISNFGVTAVAHAVLHPVSRPRLVDVPLQIDPDGRGRVELSWTVPPNALRYKLKFTQNRKIVDWLAFDPVENTFRLDPYRYCPWFAASNVPDMPDPKAPGSRDKLVLEGMDPKQTWSYVLRAYVSDEPIPQK